MAPDVRDTRSRTSPLSLLPRGIAPEILLVEDTKDQLVVGLIIGNEDRLLWLTRSKGLVLIHDDLSFSS